MEIRALVPQPHRRDYDLYNSLAPTPADIRTASSTGSPHCARRSDAPPVIDAGYRGRTATLALERSSKGPHRATGAYRGEANSSSLMNLDERRHSDSRGNVRKIEGPTPLKIKLVT